MDDYKGRTADVAVFLTIDEGPQYFVASLDIKGAGKLDLAKIRASLSSQPGQVFSEFNVAADRETIIRYYGQNGFANATFAWDSKPAKKRTPWIWSSSSTKGSSSSSGRSPFPVSITRGLALARKQLELQPGSPLSPQAMADTQENLYDLGIFSKVDMAIQNPDGEEERKYVLYDVDEARRYTITTGVGAEFARIGGETPSPIFPNLVGDPASVRAFRWT